MRRLFIKTTAICLIFLTCVALVECLFSGLAWFQYRALNVQVLNDADIGNSAVAEVREGYSGSFQPHPYLSYVRNSKAQGVNNIGTIGNDFPLVRDPTMFSILITGGSVADQLASSGHVERALAGYDFGRPVRILNGALGAGHYPQQFIVTGLYGDAADAVVTLDGFNEKNRFVGKHLRMEFEGVHFSQLNPLVEGGYDRLGASWECNRLRRLSRNTNSRAVFYLTRFLRQRIEASIQPAADNANKVWKLPEAWSPEQCNEFNLDQYRKYLALIDASAGVLKVKSAHLIQPCPAIGKALTREELRDVGPLDYAPTYQRLANDLPAVSMLDCFDGVSETVYVDFIHNNDVGKRIMAERMAAELAKLWNIPQK